MIRRLAFVLLLSLPAMAAPRALLLYDGKSDVHGEGYLSARYISNLLGHFGVTAESRGIETYRKGDTERYPYVFFAGTVAHTRLPKDFLDDVARTETHVIWLGRHIEQLVGQGPADPGARLFGFRFIDYDDEGEFETVLYHGVRIPKGDQDLNLVTVQDPQKVTVHATAARHNGIPYPYALQRQNFWYFADSPFSYSNEGDRYLVFCDLLHDIFSDIGGTAHHASHRAMVRLEDISVDSDPQELRAVADYLHSQGVPFQIALYPIYRDPQKGLDIHLSDRRDVAEALRYMVAQGGTVVLHGTTHQYHGVSGDDYELWSDLTDSPINNDTADRLDRNLDMAFRECFANGLYPVAWETPHNAASAFDYQTLGKYFSVFNERILAGEAVASEQYFPYVVRDAYGRMIIPENLGFIKVGETNPQPVVDHARATLVVRDGLAGFYFHPFMKLEYLKQMVGGIRALGYDFVSLREFNPRVNFRNWRVEIAGGAPNFEPAAVAGPSGYVHRVVLSRSGAVLEDVVVPAARASGAVPRGALLALESASGPRKEADHSVPSRLRSWFQTVAQRDTPTALPDFQPVRAVILWNQDARGKQAVEQQAFENVLHTYGLTPVRLEAKTFSRAPGDALLVIPAASASLLRPAQVEGALDHLRQGHPVLLAGRSDLAARLGIQFGGRRSPVSQATDLNHPERFLRWAPEEQVERFDPPEDAVPLMLDPTTRQVLAFSGRWQQGSYLFLSTPLDSKSPLGLTRYPYLANHMEEVFRYRPRAIRPHLEAYFDPGYRQGVDLTRLVNSWRKSGIRMVHVAAFQFWPKYTFNYRQLIDLCHRNGIAVYAWFELPEVSKKFWDEHPEWREKTALGADAQVGWRLLMNLYNPDARREAFAFVNGLLEQEEWDGVNIAELNYDAADNFLDPAKFVPMNADVRQEFQRRHGFDPQELFRPGSPHSWQRDPRGLRAFTDFRVEMVTDLHRALLQDLEPVRRKKDLEVVVTMMDSLHSPRIREQIGVDSREILKLMDHFGFTLQVEDPSEFWAASPERYREFGSTYQKLVKDPARLMFDVNVVADRTVTASDLPSQLATGTEFARLLLAASAPTGRAAIYSEWTVTPQDWQWAGAVLASGTRVTPYDGADAWQIDSPQAVSLRVPREIRTFYLDAKPWPAFEEGSVMIPAGKHLLSFSRPQGLTSWMEMDQLQVHLRSISGELLDADVTRRGMQLEYTSPGRCVVLFNKQPYNVRVDGLEWTAAPLYSRGEWALVLPSGRHKVDLVANQTAVFVVEASSLVFSWLIVGFGTVSCGAMLGLYTMVRLQRAARRLRRRWVA